MGERIQLNPKAKAMLLSVKDMPKSIPVNGKAYTLKHHMGAGYKGVVWKCLNEFSNEVAIKFAANEDYIKRSFKEEIALRSKLIGYPRFARFLDAGVRELELPDNTKYKVVCFVEEWVEGDTLNEYLTKNIDIPLSFLISFVRLMCDALSNLQYNKLCHDDLHAENIKITKPKPGSLVEDIIDLKIVDTGSLKPIETRKKEKDDHLWFVEHIVSIINKIKKNKKSTKPERCFLSKIKPFLDVMLDEDYSRALRDPKQIKKLFESTYSDAKFPRIDSDKKLTDPFHYISAETIHSDQLLVSLFAESCPWKKEVSGPDPLLLTGPRGCGKSTIFRRLSLKGVIYKGKVEMEKSDIGAFYISCSSDLRNRVNWITTGAIATKFRKEILHYFNLLLSREVIHTLIIILKNAECKPLFGLTTDKQLEINKFIIAKLEVNPDNRFRFKGISPLEHTLEMIEMEMENCYGKLMKGENWSKTTSASYISDFTKFISSIIPYFNTRKIVFFIDDLSTRQIPECVQEILNEVILLERATHHIFKISSDKYGWIGVDVSAQVGEKTREFREIDCAKHFIVDVDKETKINFTKELLSKRLRMSGYKATPEQIIGKSNYNQGSLGKEIRWRYDNHKGIQDVYFGLETITDLCCGDISVLLEIFRRIFEIGKIESCTIEMVAPNKQTKAITSISREQLNCIKTYVPFGEKMYNMASHFGTMGANILKYGNLQKNLDKERPIEIPRIEIDEDPNQTFMGFDKEQKEIQIELVKRSIFIELDLGRSRHGNTPSFRLHFRPILCPTFGMSLSKNEAIKWKPEDFKFFLTAPKVACEQEFENRMNGKKSHNGEDNSKDTQEKLDAHLGDSTKNE